MTVMKFQLLSKIITKIWTQENANLAPLIVSNVTVLNAFNAHQI